MGLVGTIFVIFIAVALYFMPAFIAAGRNHHNGWSIIVFNLLLGWTFLGWVVALVWSLSAIEPQYARGNKMPDINARKPEPTRDRSSRYPENAKDNRCPHCGRPIDSGASHCVKCGATIGWSRLGGADYLSPTVSSPPEKPKTKELPTIAAEQNEDKVCPDCAETIKAAAKVCRYCGYRFENEETG